MTLKNTEKTEAETRKRNTSFRAGSNTHPLGARFKGSNGEVAVGLLKAV